MLDLSALEEKSVPVSSSGAPLELPLDDIEEDAGQPRKEFDEARMLEMTSSVKMRGVRQPVSVRPHPEKPGKWILNFGARRLRASRQAGRATIPAFVDETSDDFDQVIENEERDNLKPMELALFIKGKLAKGIKKAEIARRLSRPASTITELLALVDAPACIEAIYRSGRCTSPKTLYDLRALHDAFRAEVETWCATADEITRKSVADLAARLKSSLRHTAQENLEDHDHEGNGQVDGGKQNANYAPIDGASTPDVKTDEPPRGKVLSASDPEFMKKPLLLVEHDGRGAVVLLNQRPSSIGLIHVCYEDDGSRAEVAADALKINQLTDAGLR
jgi:ParB family chromosome partitioning protein